MEVRNVAGQANAMGFIMQSDDDFESLAVQARLKSTFQDVAKSIIQRAAQYPNLASVP